MRVFKRLRRALKLRRIIRKHSVWTRDSAGKVYYYDILVCPLSDGMRFLVRFTRHSMSTGNKLQVHRILRTPEVFKLELQAN